MLFWLLLLLLLSGSGLPATAPASPVNAVARSDVAAGCGLLRLVADVLCVVRRFFARALGRLAEVLSSSWGLLFAVVGHVVRLCVLCVRVFYVFVFVCVVYC